MSSKRSGSSSGAVWKTIAFIVAAAVLLAHFDVIRLPWQKTDVRKMLDNPTLYTPAAADIETDAATDISYVNNIILIFFNPGTTDREMQKAVDSVDGEVVGCLAAIDQLQVKVKTASLDELEDMCSTLAQRSEVAFATYDTAVVVTDGTIPDDPWGTDEGRSVNWNANSPVDANWWVNATDAMYAWDYADQMQPVTVGIVDDGFDTSHEDLAGRIRLITTNNSVEAHGTHVAGIIGATHNNRRGISGIVPNCDIITADWMLTSEQEAALTAQGGQWSTLNKILGETVTLVENGAKVVNLSIRVPLPPGVRSWDYNGEGHQASMYLQSLLARGYDFVIVQCSGNGDAEGVALDALYNGLFCSITYENCATGNGVLPADIMERIIVVGAAGLDPNGGYVQAPWSNAGTRVDLCAPGVNVYSTLPGNTYGCYSGTSMAAPIVAGTAAMVWGMNPDLTGPDVKHIVCENTRDVVKSGYGAAHPFYDEYPMVNTLLAVEAAMQTGGAGRAPDPAERYASVLSAYRSSREELRSNHTVTAAGSLRFYAAADTDTLYYAFHDIDSNGTPELLIGGYTYAAEGSIQILDVYGLNGDSPVCLYRPAKADYEYPPGSVPMFHEGEIPSYLRIFSDGTICARVGSTDDPACYVRSRIGPDGHSLQTLQGLFASCTPMNPSSPDEPDYLYYAYSEDCPDMNMDYDDFIPYCLNLYGAPFLQSDAHGVQNDFDAWTVRYCSQYGSRIAPEWIAL